MRCGEVVISFGLTHLFLTIYTGFIVSFPTFFFRVRKREKFLKAEVLEEVFKNEY